MPAASADGLTTASGASGRAVANGPASVDCAAAIGAEGTADDSVAATSRGAAVCSAAQGDTPGTYDTHGAYVSDVTSSNAGAQAEGTAAEDADTRMSDEASTGDEGTSGSAHASIGLDVAGSATAGAGNSTVGLDTAATATAGGEAAVHLP